MGVILAPTVPLGFFARRQTVPLPDPRVLMLKSIAAPPPPLRDRAIAAAKYLSGGGAAISCETRKFAGGPPAPSAIEVDRGESAPTVDPAVEFLHSDAVPHDERWKFIRAVQVGDVGKAGDVVTELVDRFGPQAPCLLKLLPSRAAAAPQPQRTSTTIELAKIMSAGRQRRAVEDARRANGIQDAMRQRGLKVIRTPAVTIRKMFEVADRDFEAYPNKRSVQVLIKSAVTEPDASVLLNWIGALNHMPIRKAAEERNSAPFKALLKCLDRHRLTPAQAGAIRKGLMGGY
jgi:hypothetical protein